ncbi:hypothetical protein [Burkholderia gladioli]|uniref:hypothetical protein n=1 Tax=Burkholderia gladioli TaxID=28095 RepID=UPI000D008446|nr:hypothetical protein [Burkholderia gladioli]PRG56858.1 hypothetical protein C6V06_04215 [Burkholderia gladioli]
MQTTKARARWLIGGNYPLWEVSHADTGVKTWADRPHDAAAYLLKEFVLYGQVEKRAGLDAIRVPASCSERDIEQLREAFRKPVFFGIDYAAGADQGVWDLFVPAALAGQ